MYYYVNVISYVNAISYPVQHSTIINFQYQVRSVLMGAICKKSTQTEASSTVQLSNLHGFEGMTFTFTVNQVSRLQAECLVIFTDKKLKVDKNQYLLKCSKSVANKVQQYLDVCLMKTKIVPGQSVLLDVLIEEFGFGKIFVVCLEVWAGQATAQIIGPLKQCFNKFMLKLKQQKVESFALTDCNSQFGLPVHITHKQLIRVIHENKTGLKDVTFLSLNDDDMIQMKKTVSEFSQHMSEQDSASKTSSEYY